jgi:hypothetical protein
MSLMAVLESAAPSEVSPMTINEVSTYRAKAEHCSKQSSLTKDDRLKKYWDDLANHWTALSDVMMEKDVYDKPR